MTMTRYGIFEYSKAFSRAQLLFAVSLPAEDQKDSIRSLLLRATSVFYGSSYAGNGWFTAVEPTRLGDDKYDVTEEELEACASLTLPENELECLHFLLTTINDSPRLWADRNEFEERSKQAEAELAQKLQEKEEREAASATIPAGASVYCREPHPLGSLENDIVNFSSYAYDARQVIPVSEVEVTEELLATLTIHELPYYLQSEMGHFWGEVSDLRLPAVEHFGRRPGLEYFGRTADEVALKFAVKLAWEAKFGRTESPISGREYWEHALQVGKTKRGGPFC